jgi:uncharacterized ion transporter superfamily protein YfcC
MRIPALRRGTALAGRTGLVQAAAVVFFCFLVGAMTVLKTCVAVGNTLDHLVSRFGHRRGLILLLVTTLFLVGGTCLDSLRTGRPFRILLICGQRAGNSQAAKTRCHAPS